MTYDIAHDIIIMKYTSIHTIRLAAKKGRKNKRIK